MARLQGKRTIVTGAGSGIGRASAKAFAKEGAAVLCVDKADAVHETAEMIAKAGGKALAVTADVGVESEVKAYVERAVKEFGGLDAIYANAGISGGYVPIVEQTVEHALIGGLDLEQPALAVGVGVDQLGLGVQRLVDRGHRAADRCVDVAHGLGRLQLPHCVPGRDSGAGLGQGHVDDVAELVLGIVGDADAQDAVALPNPLVLCGVLEVLG